MAKESACFLFPRRALEQGQHIRLCRSAFSRERKPEDYL
jgi:hypothetical protein